MFEIKITIEAPAIVEAIKGLAGACSIKCAAPVSFAAPPMHPEVTSGVAPQQKQPEALPVMNPPVSPEPEKQETVAAPVQQEAATQADAAPQVTLDDLSRAGASLVDKGKMPQVIKLLEKYGVQAITQLKQDQYPAIAEDFRALGGVM